MIKTIEYYPDGSVKRIEFEPQRGLTQPHPFYPTYPPEFPNIPYGPSPWDRPDFGGVRITD